MNNLSFPVTESKKVLISQLYANDYNPNRMPDIEMGLLRDCINKYGFLFPIIVTSADKRVTDNGEPMYRIIDGYHRYETLKRMNSSHAVVVDLDITEEECVQLTVLMNRIKGMHQVEKMSDLVVRLSEEGLKDSEICENLGMEIEEFIKLKQQLGIAHSFRHHEFCNTWDIDKEAYGLKRKS